MFSAKVNLKFQDSMTGITGGLQITLPLNTKMSMEDAEYVIENFTEIVKGM